LRPKRIFELRSPHLRTDRKHKRHTTGAIGDCGFGSIVDKIGALDQPSEVISRSRGDASMPGRHSQPRVILWSLAALALAWGGAHAQAPAQASKPTRQEIIADLVAAHHILAKFGVLDGFGHVSARDPANPQRYLMPISIAPALVGPADIIEFDLDSNAVDPSRGNGAIEKFIHGEIYKKRADVNAIVHSHAPAVIPFTVSQTPLRAISHAAAFLSPAVPVFDLREAHGASNLLVSNGALGKALAEALDNHAVVLIRGHGNAVVAANVGLATYRAYYTEVGARLLLQARALEGPIAYLHPEDAAKADEQHQRGYVRQWDLWKRELGQN
jgi:HCOMODA/2-hydroxy-3-carboxy-muconic semialdehyde decarboxylase